MVVYTLGVCNRQQFLCGIGTRVGLWLDGSSTGDNRTIHRAGESEYYD